jgi:hypothetical protein
MVLSQVKHGCKATLYYLGFLLLCYPESITNFPSPSSISEKSAYCSVFEFSTTATSWVSQHALNKKLNYLLMEDSAQSPDVSSALAAKLSRMKRKSDS